MEAASPPPRPLPIPRFLLAFTVALAIVFTTGCGSRGSMSTPALSGNTLVTVLLSSTANDQLSQFNTSFSSVTLTSQSGETVNLFTTRQKAAFIHLNGTAEPLVTVSVLQDVYTAATATIGGYTGFTCVSLLSSSGLQTSFIALGSTPPATVTLPSPITVTGTAMGLLLDLQVGQSATYSSCNLQGATYSITTTFNLTPVALASPPTDVENGKGTGLEGQIASVDTAGNSFSVVAADGPSWSVQSNGSTVYQGISGFSGLVAGMPVDMDAAIQPDGSRLATRVAVEDADSTNLNLHARRLR